MRILSRITSLTNPKEMTTMIDFHPITTTFTTHNVDEADVLNEIFANHPNQDITFSLREENGVTTWTVMFPDFSSFIEVNSAIGVHNLGL